MLKRMASILILVMAATAVPAARADADPTLRQVYEAAQSGRLAEAQQMMKQVLRDHPASAKAHYVSAEIDARAGNLTAARDELATAERLAPGLPFARADAVQALRRQLSPGARYSLTPLSAGRTASTPWGLILVVVAGVGIAWVMFGRRRAASAAYASAPGALPAPAGMAPGSAGTVAGPTVGAGGSGLLGNIAGGLAVGAGVVAGEELMRHVLDRDRPEVPPQRLEGAEPPQNPDMGGTDFGVNDAGSWDDGGSNGGGGDDWS